ncbi:MAG: alpha/beta hydrolase [bacterium]
MRVAVIIVLVLVLVVAGFVFVPGVQALVAPMPGALRKMVRESERKAPVAGVVHRDLVYGASWAGRRRLDLYEPLAPYPAGRPPIVVFLHGGSWVHGDKITIRVVDRFLERMRQAGYFVAAVNYTTTLLRGFEGPVENTRRAVEWLASRADEFGYDAHNIGMYGVSAGGHLGLLAGSTMEGDDYDFAFLFGECAPTDLVAMRDGDAFSHSVAFRFFREKRLRELSPVSYVRTDLPPVLLYHGGQDQTVHIRQSRRYADALRAAGADVELVVYPEGNHAFLNLTDDVWYEQETRALEYFARKFGERVPW